MRDAQVPISKPSLREVALPYLARLLLFHLFWVGILISIDLVKQLVAPTDSFIWQWYLALLPVIFLIVSLLFLPVSIGIGAIVLWATPRSRYSRRLVAIGLATSVWAVALAAAVLVGFFQEGRSLDVVLIGCLIYGVLMPLPTRAPSGESTKAT